MHMHLSWKKVTTSSSFLISLIPAQSLASFRSSFLAFQCLKTTGRSLGTSLVSPQVPSYTHVGFLLHNEELHVNVFSLERWKAGNGDGDKAMNITKTKVLYSMVCVEGRALIHYGCCRHLCLEINTSWHKFRTIYMYMCLHYTCTFDL